jgi:NTE family protein
MRRLGILLAIGGTLLAQPADRPARPRIGLVLSGGGALGLSHVGVIQWLEEHHIPIAYVGGTSMGGLVGGLFATGHDATEIKQFVRSIDWPVMFNPAPPFRDLAFRRKEDRREFPNKLEMGLKHGLRLPPGISPGHEVGLALSRFAAPYSEYRSFDDLPTPFRCVATNLINGEQVVFSQGSLPIALRATMSLPAIFSPLEAEDMVLADGGMLNNLPVDVVKGMGAELTLAVALVDPEAKKDSLSSLLDVAKRSISIMIDANERRSMALADLLIIPDMAGFTAKDFARYEEMEQRGYQAAESKKTFLSTLSVTEDEWLQYLAERKRKRLPKQITPTFVTVRGVEGTRQKSLEEELDSRLKGQILTPEKIDSSLTEITGYGPYQSASYAFARKDGGDGVLVDVQPKSYGPPILNTGINVEGSDTSEIRFGVGARLTFLDFGGPNSEWRSDITIGLDNSVSSEYYRRFGLTRWFVAPRGFFSRRQEDVYSDKTRTSILKVQEGGGGADLGYAVSRFQELRLGYQYDYVSPSVSSGVLIPWLSAAAAGLQSVRFRWAYDGQDSGIIPRHGIRSTLDARWVFGTPTGVPQFGTIEQQFLIPKSFGPRYTIVSALNGGTVVGPKAYLPPFTLGGAGDLSALARQQLRGEHYYYGGMQGLRAFSADRTSFLNKINLDLGFEMGQAFSSTDSGKPIYDGLLGVVGESPVGIVFVGWSCGSSGNHKFFFRIGRLF